MEEKILRKIGLNDLVKELERQKKNSLDVVVDTEMLKAVARDDGVKLRVPHPPKDNIQPANTEVLDLTALDEKLRNGEITIDEVNNPEVEECVYPLNLYAHKQLADKTSIPWKYYERMMVNKKYPLLNANINTWLGEREKRLIRILDGQVRAILSDRYRPIDNFDLVWKFLEVMKQHKENGEEIKIFDCNLTEQRMYIRVLLPWEEEIGKLANGEHDLVKPSIVLSNSEVGSGKMALNYGMVVSYCNNGLIGIDLLSRVHLGSKLEEGVVEWSEQTIRKTDEALFSQLEDALNTAFDRKIWDDYVTKVKTGQSRVLEPTISEIVENLSPKYHISEEEKKTLLDTFSEEAGLRGKTQWALSNGITQLARDTESPERQIELERLGHEVATMGEKEIVLAIAK